jgi:hypothetical protein
VAKPSAPNICVVQSRSIGTHASGVLSPFLDPFSQHAGGVRTTCLTIRVGGNMQPSKPSSFLCGIGFIDTFIPKSN